MATATYSVTTSASNLANVWRYVQAGIYVAYNFGVEEWNALMKFEKFDVDWSARSITFETDLNDDINTASIPEGGKEARPSSQTVQTATVTWILLNKRFTISKTARYIQQQQGTRGQLENQLKFQAKKAVQGMHRKLGDLFWGKSDGVGALVSAVTGDSITLKDMYGVTGFGATGDARQASHLFRVSDYIAVLNPTGPTLRGAISAITTVTDASNVIVAGASAIASATANDYVVFANNLENTTVTGGTEYNLGLVGIQDMINTTSVHSLSNARWTAAVNNTSGGRFTGIKLRNLKQQIRNKGGGELTTVWWANGVENDVVAQLQAGLRFSDAWGMEMDGQPASKGITFNTSRRVPDGVAVGWDSRNSVKKMVLLPEPSENVSYDDEGHKLQDDSGYIFSLDYPCAMVTTNRSNMGQYSSLTES